MKVFLETYGCQMNEYDSELIRSILTKANYSFVKTESEADVIMLNTCAVRENAHRKVYGRIHDIRHDLNGKTPLIGILGCMATNLRKELLESRNLKIDFIAGPDSYKKLPDLIRAAGETGDKPFDLTLSEFETYSDVYPTREKGVNAWIAVMRGCNNFCSFCVVPYTRGRERSRAPENVLSEVRRLADEGFKQVTLLGQNVNSYNYEGSDFADLLDKVSTVKGIERIRFTSPHPKDFPERLLKVVAQNPKVCKHIHFPLQAGNDRILDMMIRTYTKEEYLGLVDKIRSLCPDVALTTDIIVGFPTETDSDFQDTVDVVKKVQYDAAFIFKYSVRKNTIAENKYPDDVPDAIKAERTVLLNDLQKEISLIKNRSYVGQTHSILIEEERTTRSDEHFQGRTDTNIIVIIPKGPYKIGDFVDVKITSATPHVLKGQIFNNQSPNHNNQIISNIQ
ncbi:MAG: tRNA (N6-isopentenyl adenosine(37)-C2)-methylthiotransferase MiaB [Candidatus Omnitrophota bacterium]